MNNLSIILKYYLFIAITIFCCFACTSKTMDLSDWRNNNSEWNSRGSANAKTGKSNENPNNKKVNQNDSSGYTSAWGGPSTSASTTLKQPKLFVETEPENATVQILNIKSKFHQGIELGPGDYHLDISANGYERSRKWISMSKGEEKILNISLQKIIDVSPIEKKYSSISQKTKIRPSSITKSNPYRNRTALVIGNSAYKDSPLRNPINDADDLTISLRKLGFKVIQKKDADRRSMIDAIRNFGKKANDGVALFYFAGHGIQLKGENFLVPVDTLINSEADVEHEGVSVGRILSQMEYADSKLNIVILDACRNNPFSRNFRSSSRGLAVVTAPEGSIIAYATAPGKLAADGSGSNGVYTKYLLKFLDEPNLSIEDFFKKVGKSVATETGKKQRPWISSDFFGDFSFNPR